MLDRRRKSSGLTIETIEEIANTHSVYVYNSQIRSTASGACLGSGSLKIDGLPITDDYNKFVAEFLSRNKIDSKLEKAI
jgi:hypothetical protein